MQPDLTASRTYTSTMCFQDSMEKDLMAERSLLEPLPDLKLKGGRSPFFASFTCVICQLILFIKTCPQNLSKIAALNQLHVLDFRSTS